MICLESQPPPYCWFATVVKGGTVESDCLPQALPALQPVQDKNRFCIFSSSWHFIQVPVLSASAVGQHNSSLIFISLHVYSTSKRTPTTRFRKQSYLRCWMPDKCFKNKFSGYLLSKHHIYRFPKHNQRLKLMCHSPVKRKTKNSAILL